jgi:hypothetical protein
VKTAYSFSRGERFWFAMLWVGGEGRCVAAGINPYRRAA